MRSPTGRPSGTAATAARRTSPVIVTMVGPGQSMVCGPPPAAMAARMPGSVHGNESAGWLALREVLSRHRGAPLPRSLVLFIGNVAAARANVRHLEDQPDFNRIWRGNGTPYHAMAAEVLSIVRERGIVAAVDVHNTTGRNPQQYDENDDSDTIVEERFTRNLRL